jgi:lysozyme
LIERFEGFSSCPYFDPFGGVWTIGFGVTSGSGASVGPGTPCESHAGAQRQLQALLESRYEWAINALGVPLDQHERDALCSFVWNLGAGIFEGTTVGADLHSRHFYAATRQMLAYDHAGGVLLEGLRVRRQAEVALFLSAEPRPKPAPKPSRAKLLAEREALRRLERRHHCLLPPKYGGGRYHKACEVWRPQGNRIDRELRG